MTYLLNSTTTPEPGTHAIVIGVGKYLPNRWNLSDLDSAIPSANAFVDWLLSDARQPHANPVAPLLSVELLASPVAGQLRRADVHGNMLDIELATMHNVEAAIQRWYLKGNQDLNSRLIFYFCGHGINRGEFQFLLLEGFAGPECFAYRNFGIHFSEFASGMELCKARKQVYFLDCCRDQPVASTTTLAPLGKSIIDFDLSLKQTNIPRDWPAICASAVGQAAFGQGVNVSQFTKALIKALQECGWEDRNNPWQDWCVESDSLARFITELLVYEELVRGAPRQDAQNIGSSSGFVFHFPPPGTIPRVPLLIGSAHPSVSVDGMPLAPRAAGSAYWEVQLPATQTCTIVASNGAVVTTKSIPLRPACKIVEL